MGVKRHINENLWRRAAGFRVATDEANLPNFLDILMMDELRHADVVEQALWEIVDLYLAGVIKPLVRRRLPNGARGSLLAAMITLETFGR
jgi:hypothetical protein